MCRGTTSLNISKAGKFSTKTLPIRTVKSESEEFWSVKLVRKVLFGTSCKFAMGPSSSKWVGFTRSRYALWFHQCKSLFWLLDVISDASNFRSTLSNTMLKLHGRFSCRFFSSSCKMDKDASTAFIPSTTSSPAADSWSSSSFLVSKSLLSHANWQLFSRYLVLFLSTFGVADHNLLQEGPRQG